MWMCVLVRVHGYLGCAECATRASLYRMGVRVCSFVRMRVCLEDVAISSTGGENTEIKQPTLFVHPHTRTLCTRRPCTCYCEAVACNRGSCGVCSPCARGLSHELSIWAIDTVGSHDVSAVGHGSPMELGPDALCVCAGVLGSVGAPPPLPVTFVNAAKHSV